MSIRNAPLMLRPLKVANTASRPLKSAHLSTARRLYAAESYGGGQGDPRGENPQQQGPNPAVDQEHPGPPPPNVGQGKSSGTSAESESKSKSSPEPKIHKDEAPSADNHSDEVKAHNEEMKNRHDRPVETTGDDEKVDKGFWKGTSS